MWIAKIKYKHDCILGNRCEKFKVNLQSIAFTVFKDKGKTITSSLHCMSGNPKNIQQFIQNLKNEKAVLKLERNGNMFFLLEKADLKAVAQYTPKLIFIKPVIMDTKGWETWEVGSWERNEVEQFVKGVKNKIKNFQLLKFYNSPLNEVFFPRLLPKLTDKQKRAVELVIEEGYYHNPRKIDLRKLAKIMKLSLATYQQHLRVAEAKLIPNLLDYSE